MRGRAPSRAKPTLYYDDKYNAINPKLTTLVPQSLHFSFSDAQHDAIYKSGERNEKAHGWQRCNILCKTNAMNCVCWHWRKACSTNCRGTSFCGNDANIRTRRVSGLKSLSHNWSILMEQKSNVSGLRNSTSDVAFVNTITWGLRQTS